MATGFDASKIHMGPAKITYDSNVLGYTLNDSVKINISMETTPVTPDQASLPIMDVVTGTTVTVDVTCGQVTDALATLVGVSESKFTDPGGTDLKKVAKQLKVEPYSTADDGSTTSSGTAYTFPLAVPIPTDGISFAKTTPQGITLSFKVYANTSGEFMSWA